LGFYTSSCSTVQTTNDPGYVFTSPATAIAGGLTDSLGRRGLTGVDRTDDRRRGPFTQAPALLMRSPEGLKEEDRVSIK
jgi:hypothetical protein